MSDVTHIQEEPQRPAQLAKRSPLGIIIASIVIILLILLALWAIPGLFGSPRGANVDSSAHGETRILPSGTQ